MSKAPVRTDYLATNNIDDIARMLMALTQETWAMRDRMAVTEKLLETKLGITAADIDDYVADPAFKAEIEKLRNRFVAKVAGAPIAARERGVDQILERAGMSRPKT